MYKTATSLVITLLLLTVSAVAQRSTPQAIALSAEVQEYISVGIPTATVVHFLLDPNSTSAVQGDAKPSWVTTYSLKKNTIVNVCAYLGGDLFSAATGDTIPMSAIDGQKNGTGSFLPFNSTVCCGNANGILIQSYILSAADHKGSKTNSIGLQMHPNVAAQPGTYSGTLNIVAQAQ